MGWGWMCGYGEMCTGCGVVVFVHVFACVVGTGTINQEMFVLKNFHVLYFVFNFHRQVY